MRGRSSTSAEKLSSGEVVEIVYFDRQRVEEALSRLARSLKSLPEVEGVLAFGTFVKGESVPGSDVDLLIVLRDSAKPFLDRIPDYLPDRFPVGVDVFPYTRAEVDRMLQAGNLFVKSILEEGRELDAKQ